MNQSNSQAPPVDESGPITVNNPWLEAAPQQQAASNQKRLSSGPITVNNLWLEAAKKRLSKQKRLSQFFFLVCKKKE